ncbi:hypothetical protein [Halosimplex pelagicum]|uniref:Twin-arginine translocation signal domain-containing protein n=1 Tax=Halosimplex pelagicum TaxID=869886 RepID=A0A7D5PBQ7_9EURY|nr:hypothetical protein [Halosimplex pelagicum]QLH83964.1 hypothetical protein HZS54_21025 [Halosimplex pelagicum]
MTNDDSGAGIDRRGVLKMIGGATAGIGLLSGTASAHRWTFDGCESVCTDTDGNYAVVEAGVRYEGRTLPAAPERDVPWGHDNTFCYTAADDERVVGFIEEDEYRKGEGCTLHVNPNDCVSVGADEILSLIDRDTIGICDSELYPACDPTLPESDWVDFARTFESERDASAQSLIRTTDGGFALTGRRLTGEGNIDASLLVTDGDGDVVFDRTYGGDETEVTYDVVETSDGGFAMAGLTESYGEGSSSAWLVKTDDEGNVEFTEAYGDGLRNRAFGLVQTADGGFALGGDATPPDSLDSDFWLIKTDEEGNEAFSRTYDGGTARAMIQTSDGGFALTGSTFLQDSGENAALFLKTDDAGNEEFSTAIDSEGVWSANALVETDDGGFALAGSGVAEGRAGECWLVKTDDAGNEEFVRSYGGDELDLADGIARTDDGGFALAGLTESFDAEGSDVYFLRTDESGEVTFERVYGSCGHDRARDLVRTADGGFALAGDVAGSERIRPTEMALVKTAADLE